MANRLTSGPSRNSSITTRPQEAAWSTATWRSVVTTTPLPAARPSSLTTYGDPSSSSAAATSSAVSHTRAAAVGTPAAAITSLAKALLPSSCAACPGRAEAGDPGVADGVGHAGHQRGLRAHHHQVDPELGGQGGDRLRVVGSHRVVGAHLRGPRVARGGVHLDHRRVPGEGQGERVLAAAGADDEDAEAPGGIRWLDQVGRRHPRSLPIAGPGDEKRDRSTGLDTC